MDQSIHSFLRKEPRSLNTYVFLIFLICFSATPCGHFTCESIETSVSQKPVKSKYEFRADLVPPETDALHATFTETKIKSSWHLSWLERKSI